MEKCERCPCGGIILADTEDWKTPLCYSCYSDLLEINESAKMVINALKSENSKLREALERISTEASGVCLGKWSGKPHDYPDAIQTQTLAREALTSRGG